MKNYGLYLIAVFLLKFVLLNLPSGATIENTAFIYFDQNPPVITNTTLNTIDINLSIATIDPDDLSPVIYPNPFNDEFSLQLAHFLPSEDYQLELYDVAGRKLFTHDVLSNPSHHFIEGLRNGYYILLIKDSYGHILSSHKLMHHH